MYKSVLIPTDGSELAEKAVRYGIAFSKEVGAKVTMVTPAQYKKRIQDHAAKVLSAAAEAAKAVGVTCETVHVEHEHPHQAIIDTGNSKDCDLIAMASHGRRGVAAMVLGSETIKVLTHCKIPVLVHR